jgi:hypothetical protein
MASKLEVPALQSRFDVAMSALCSERTSLSARQMPIFDRRSHTTNSKDYGNSDQALNDAAMALARLWRAR